MSTAGARTWPIVSPTGSGYDAGVLGALLIIERNIKVGSGKDAATEVVGDKRKYKFGHFQSHTTTQLGIVVVYNALDCTQKSDLPT